jgi:hypothetical protein
MLHHRSRLAIGFGIASAMLSATGAFADCTCRAGGQDYEVGSTVCLQTPKGQRLATCGMVLNNTSWRFSDKPCTGPEVNSAPVDRSHAAKDHHHDDKGG